MSTPIWPTRLLHPDLVLRPLMRRDKAQWDEVRRVNESWLRRWEATNPPGGAPGPATFGALVKLLNGQAKRGQSLPWALCLNPGEDRLGQAKVIGQVTVSGITRGSACFAQIGYWIDRREAGRGLVPTAVALATDYCFRDLGLHRIEIAIRPENVNSLRVVEKLGFRHEGSRPRYLHIDGEWRDHEVFALNAEEVPAGVLGRWERVRRTA